MNKQYHNILQRKIKKHFKDADAYPQELAGLFESLSESFHQSDDDRKMLERSLDLSSKELLQKNGELQKVFQSLPELFLWINKDKRVVRADSALDPVHFFPNKKILGEQIDQVFDENIVHDVFSAIDAVAASQSIEDISYTIEGIDGLRYFEMRILFVEDEKLLCIIRDITDQKNREIAEKQKNEAQAKAEAKGNFLANMSHEIRTPMNAILGFADLLANTEMDEQQVRYLNTIKSSGTLLVGIINDILDVSKLESGKLVLETIDFNLIDLATEVFKMLTSRLRGSGLEVYIQIDERIPQYFQGDPTRLKQVLVNLLSNAIKFTSEGSIGVLVAVDRVNDATREMDLRFTVKDTGIGIQKEKIDSVFDSFTQADESTTREYGGTGLGLAISKAIVDAMEGKIWAESTQGEGSEFIFTITLKKGSSPQDVDHHANAKKVLKGKKVVIIDDQEIAQKVHIKLCEEIGLDVLSVAETANGALQKLDEFAQQDVYPDYLLTDIVMPDTDGIELAKKIRSNKKYNDTKIIAVTGDFRKNLSLQQDINCFDEIITKPLTKFELTEYLLKAAKRSLGNPDVVAADLESSQDLKGAHVLVVEDAIPNQELLKAYFTSFECTADYANNGRQAVDLLKATPGKYDLCLMDMQMPVMGGAEATEYIRRYLDKELPIIALTAGALKEDEDNALKAGVNEFLTKPIDIVKLKTTMSQYHKKKQRV